MSYSKSLCAKSSNSTIVKVECSSRWQMNGMQCGILGSVGEVKYLKNMFSGVSLFYLYLGCSIPAYYLERGVQFHCNCPITNSTVVTHSLKGFKYFYGV